MICTSSFFINILVGHIFFIYYYYQDDVWFSQDHSWVLLSWAITIINNISVSAHTSVDACAGMLVLCVCGAHSQRDPKYFSNPSVYMCVRVCV